MSYKETNTYKGLKDRPQNNFPKWLIVHHTGGGDNNPFMTTSHHTAKSVENYHLAKGWDGIGYHYFIELDGTTYKGRPEHVNGAHCKEEKMNFNSLGICLAGNFDVEDPSGAQVNSLKELLKELSAKYNISKDKIVPHRYYATYKSCYGNRLSDKWAQNLLSTNEKCICLKDATISELFAEIMNRLKTFN